METSESIKYNISQLSSLCWYHMFFLFLKVSVLFSYLEIDRLSRSDHLFARRLLCLYQWTEFVV